MAGNPQGTTPRLGLAVAAKGAGDAAGFLQACRMMRGLAAADVDIHIAHDGNGPGDGLPEAGKVHWHACPAGTSSFGLWRRAIEQTATDYVAIMDLDVPPAPGWLARVRRAMADGEPLFFGPVDPGWDRRDPRLAGYLIEYAQFRAPLQRAITEVPGNNLIGRRGLFLLPGIMTEGGFSKTAMLWRVHGNCGITARGFDDMPVIYRKGFTLRRYLRTRLSQGRGFAAHRHEQPNQPGRLLCAGFTPLLPWLRVERIARAVRRDAALRAALWRNLPLVLASEVAWSLGEFAGYVAGPER